MKQVRTHAFKLPSLRGLWLHEEELAALLGLPAWYVALFVHLARLCNFETGAGRTGYGELINLLTPDQPERGPRLWAPARQDVKRALRRLETLRLVAVDHLHSEQVQTINFLLSPRSRRGVPAGKLDPELDPGSHEGKRSKLDPGTRPGLSTGNTYPLPPVDNELSTGARARNRLREARDRLAGGGKN